MEKLITFWYAARCNVSTFRWFRPQCESTKGTRRCMRAEGHLGHHGTYSRGWFDL